MSKYESMCEYRSENGFSESIKRPLPKTKNVSGSKVWPMVTFCLEIKKMFPCNILLANKFNLFSNLIMYGLRMFSFHRKKLFGDKARFWLLHLM